MHSVIYDDRADTHHYSFDNISPGPTLCGRKRKREGPIYIYIIQILSVCLSVKYRRPNCWTDHDQIWHAYADRPGDGSYQILAP